MATKKEPTYTDFGQRVQLAKEHAGIETDVELAARVARLLGREELDPRMMQRTKTSLSSEYTPAIAEVCGVSVLWLAYGIGEMVDSTTLAPNQRQLLTSYARLPEQWRDLLDGAMRLAADAPSGASDREQMPRMLRAASALPARTRRKGRRLK